jgi:hypothetical protein
MTEQNPVDNNATKKEPNTENTMTHTAWALQKRRVPGPRRTMTIYTVPLEIGSARYDPDGTPHLFLDREPKGGYGNLVAEIILLPRGVNPKATATPDDEGDNGAEAS